MFDINCVILDGFPDRIFSNLDMTEAFGGEIVCPADTGIVVIVDNSRRCHDRILNLEGLCDVSQV